MVSVAMFRRFTGRCFIVAAPRHSRWTPLLGILLSVGLWIGCCPPTHGQVASPPLSSADRELVHRCEAMYGTVSFTQEDVPRAKKRMQAVQQFFDTMPRSKIEERLVPIRQSLYRGTHAYTSVAFVLAYYGIDFDRNAQRVVEAIQLQSAPPAKLRAVQRKREEDTGVEEVSNAVERLYRRHRSAKLLVAYLHAPTDGILAEDQAVTVSALFLAYPADVLRAAQRDLDRLSELLVYDRGGTTYDIKHGDAGLVRRTLSTLVYSRDPVTTSLAKDLHRRFDRGLRKNPPS